MMEKAGNNNSPVLFVIQVQTSGAVLPQEIKGMVCDRLTPRQRTKRGILPLVLASPLPPCCRAAALIHTGVISISRDPLKERLLLLFKVENESIHCLSSTD